MTGYGMGSPGRLNQKILRSANGQISAAEREAVFTPITLGFYTTLVCECAHESLARGKEAAPGVIRRVQVDARSCCTCASAGQQSSTTDRPGGRREAQVCAGGSKRRNSL